MPNSIQLHRVLCSTPEKIYRAFLQPDAMARWLPLLHLAKLVEPEIPDE
jgi:uncharacterized protein YndB with AHSA1/START domain